MNVLVTGGAGYIGSHTVQELLRLGHRPVVYDNLAKGHRAAVPAGVPLIDGDICDRERLAGGLKEYEIEAVVHFAADSLVGESMRQPLKYYNNNVVATLALLSTLLDTGVDRIVFSSTAAVYGEPAAYPITEDMPLQPTNVYGRTKLIIEGMLADFAAAYGLKYVALRYFNAAGAAADGSIGEDHQPETHLIPIILQAALGQRPAVEIYGTDYPTPDGTCLRDYIHVNDLAAAHVQALEYLRAGGQSRAFNLGSEHGFSVRQVIERVKQITGAEFTVRETARRGGDPAVLVASADRIRNELGWRPGQSSLDTIIATAWRWHKDHPRGFGDRAEGI